MVAPGAFVAAVGADSSEKSELHPSLFEDTLVVADLVDQCAAIGDLRHAIAAGAIAPDGIHAELADLVAGRAAGRSSAEQIAVFDSTGTALQDVAAAARIYVTCLALGSARSVALGSPD
jgi:ornithine cyclodeaminase/alanine dehydrogenase-like protein (mu-crystallin family)